MATTFTVVGLLLTLIGAAIGAQALVYTEDEALSVGLSRWAGSTRQEHLKDPSVVNLLKQSKWGRYSFTFIFFGTALQIVGTLMQAGPL